MMDQKTNPAASVTAGSCSVDRARSFTVMKDGWNLQKDQQPFEPFGGELLDDHGYPTGEFLSWLQSLSIDNVMHPHEVFDIIKSAWEYSDWGWREEETENDLKRPVVRYHISTGGWSGNEEIINALRQNPCFWPCYWHSSRRGGHHVFEVPIK